MGQAKCFQIHAAGEFWGALAMALTAVIGAVFGTVV